MIGRARPRGASADQGTTGWGAVSGTSAIATLERPGESPAKASYPDIRPVIDNPLLLVPTAEEIAYDDLVATVIATTSPDALAQDPITTTIVDLAPSSLRGQSNDQPWGEVVVAGGHVDDPARTDETAHDPSGMAMENVVVVADQAAMGWGEEPPANLVTSTASDVMSGVIAEVIARAMILAPVVRIGDLRTGSGTPLANDDTPTPPRPAPPDVSTLCLPAPDQGVAETCLLLRTEDADAPTTARAFLAWMSRNPGAVDGATVAGFIEDAVSATDVVNLPVPVPPRPRGETGSPASTDA